MASTDAKPFAFKNVAYRVTFPILDADGDPVSGATGLDSEISKDGGAFADCTNEATEIGSSGMYYLDLTSTEMNADTVAILVKTSTSGAKTTPIVLYPVEATDIPANVVAWNGAVVATPDTAGHPKVTIKSGTGMGELSLSSGAVNLTGTAIDAIHDEVVEGSLTLRQIIRILLAALAGKSGGGGTTTITFRDQADSKNRISATVDEDRNRTAVTVDGS